MKMPTTFEALTETECQLRIQAHFEASYMSTPVRHS